MTEYETVVILHPEVGDAPELVRKVQSVLEAQGGTIRGIDEWGIRELAYSIEKQRKGYYAVLQHTTTPAAVAEFERQLRLNDEVLRFLTVRQDSVPPPRVIPLSSADEVTDETTSEPTAETEVAPSSSADEVTEETTPEPTASTE